MTWLSYDCPNVLLTTLLLFPSLKSKEVGLQVQDELLKVTTELQMVSPQSAW